MDGTSEVSAFGLMTAVVWLVAQQGGSDMVCDHPLGKESPPMDDGTHAHVRTWVSERLDRERMALARATAEKWCVRVRVRVAPRHATPRLGGWVAGCLGDCLGAWVGLGCGWVPSCLGGGLGRPGWLDVLMPGTSPHAHRGRTPSVRSSLRKLRTTHPTVLRRCRYVRMAERQDEEASSSHRSSSERG